MAKCIANIIINAANESLAKGQEKYRTYFIDHNWYEKYKSAVDEYLIEKGYGDCIIY